MKSLCARGHCFDCDVILGEVAVYNYLAAHCIPVLILANRVYTATTTAQGTDAMAEGEAITLQPTSRRKEVESFVRDLDPIQVVGGFLIRFSQLYHFLLFRMESPGRG